MLVDAFNAIRSRWPNIPASSFVELVQAWAEREKVEAVVVFDGAAPPAGTASSPERVSVVASGHRETADDWIAREAERLARRGRRVWVVTSDRRLRERVARFAERTIGGGSLAQELSSFRP